MSNTEEYIAQVSHDMVKNSALGQELTDKQCETLGKIITVRGLREGDYLFNEGDMDDTLYVIVKGSLEALRAGGGGDLVSLYVLREGEMAGVLGFINGQGHSAGVRAITDSEVFCLLRPKFESLNREDPDLVYKVMRALFRTLHVILRRMHTQYAELSNYIFKQHGRY
ncbi:MAG: cyclic nucleotide-binding domain-containing protein [Candidatus Competibacteraceae bacterium]